MERATVFLMKIIAKDDNRYRLMEFLKYVFINLSFENDRSADATVTGIVRYRKHSV